MRQPYLLIVALTVTVCASARHRQSDDCPSEPPATWQAFDTAAVTALSGRYELILVSDWEELKGKQVRGPLTLQPTDSRQRFYGTRYALVPRGDRPLWGWADISFREVGALTSDSPSSRDPELPGVFVHANGWAELGVRSGMDGFSTHLRITHVSPSGFRGSWRSELGNFAIVRNGRHLPEPSGYFCALRR